MKVGYNDTDFILKKDEGDTDLIEREEYNELKKELERTKRNLEAVTKAFKKLCVILDEPIIVERY